jgi:small redox-active disulfide protein 2
MWETNKQKKKTSAVAQAGVAAALTADVANKKHEMERIVTLHAIVNRKRENMEIKILGTGCTSCRNLEKNTIAAIEEMGISASIEKVENLMDIMAYNVMRTPALVVDEKVKIMGRVPSVEEIKKYLR